MHWQVVPNSVLIVVHPADIVPSDEDWDEYLEDVTPKLGSVKGILVYSTKVGPSVSQRAKSNEAFEPYELRISIMTGSRMTRGIVTAMTWALGDKVRAFTPSNFEQAADNIGLTHDEKLKARVVLKNLGLEANIDIEAFKGD